MRQSAGWQTGTAAAVYCATLMPLCQALHSALQAAPNEVKSSPQLVPLAADALLLTLELTACLQPTHGKPGDQNSAALLLRSRQRDMPAHETVQRASCLCAKACLLQNCLFGCHDQHISKSLLRAADCHLICLCIELN